MYSLWTKTAKNCSQASNQDRVCEAPEAPSSAAPLIGGIVGGIVVVLAAVGFFVCKANKKAPQDNSKQGNMEMPSVPPAFIAPQARVCATEY